MKPEELKPILESHSKWLLGEEGGTRADLARANLTDANLARARLAGANLARANLAGAYLARADLTDANLTDANLTDANLTRAYLTGAIGLPKSIPVVKNLHQKILAAIDSGGSLEMESWHTCETTHCRAGWVITLAGPSGRLLEELLGPNVAGSLITHASCPWMERVPNWFASNEEALADIRKCAEREAP